jgi:hypothetical protein
MLLVIEVPAAIIWFIDFEILGTLRDHGLFRR